MHVFLAVACAVFVPMSLAFSAGHRAPHRGKIFPAKSILCTKHVLTKLCVPLPVYLGIALNLGCHSLFALVAYVCITKLAFMIFFKLIEEKMARWKVCAHTPAGLMPSHSLAQELSWQSQNRLRVNVRISFL